MKKHDLRVKYLEIRRKTLKKPYVYPNFIGSDIYKNCSVLLIYVSVGDEPDTRLLISEAIADGKRVYVPQCLDTQGLMTFRRIESLDELKPGMYSIDEPDSSNEEYITPTSAPIAPLQNTPSCNASTPHFPKSVCVVPGIVFDLSGHRLGYGKGYYDRYLANHPNLYTVGFCCSDCFTDFVPHEKTDRAVNAVCTEKGITYI